LRIVVPLAILAAIFAFIFGWLTFTGMSARSAPGSFETFLGRTVQRLSIPKSARSAKNPMEAIPETLVEARRHFADHCANCHANDGSGKTEIGQNLYPRVPDMRLTETQNLTQPRGDERRTAGRGFLEWALGTASFSITPRRNLAN
jgi:hypothetical protein